MCAGRRGRERPIFYITGTITGLAIIPEPTSLVLVALGGLLMLLLSLRRKSVEGKLGRNF